MKIFQRSSVDGVSSLEPCFDLIDRHIRVVKGVVTGFSTCNEEIELMDDLFDRILELFVKVEVVWDSKDGFEWALWFEAFSSGVLCINYIVDFDVERDFAFFDN